MSEKEGRRYIVIHYWMGMRQTSGYDDLGEAQRKYAAYKELGMVGYLSGVYTKVWGL